jgi:hypothetical protein
MLYCSLHLCDKETKMNSEHRTMQVEVHKDWKEHLGHSELLTTEQFGESFCLAIKCTKDQAILFVLKDNIFYEAIK